MAKAIKLFVSYSHQNEDQKDRLLRHLKLLERQGLIEPWDDRQISPAEEWEPEILQHLEAAKLILLLISADFLFSDYCWGIELRRAIERHEAGEVKVIPIFVMACDWKDAPFAKIQGLPRDATPVSKYRNKDDAYAKIARAIRDVVQRMSHPPAPGSGPTSVPARNQSASPSGSPTSAYDIWCEKLEFLLKEEAIITDAAQKFQLSRLIQEARDKIKELKAH